MNSEEAEWRKHIIRRLQRDADRICRLIVSTDCPEEQINIQRLALRTDAARYLPDRLHLYDLIYESRFRRLWQQFRGEARLKSAGGDGKENSEGIAQRTNG